MVHWGLRDGAMKGGEGSQLLIIPSLGDLS